MTAEIEIIVTREGTSHGVFTHGVSQHIYWLAKYRHGPDGLWQVVGNFQSEKDAENAVELAVANLRTA